jgi:hypothetical protein
MPSAKQPQEPEPDELRVAKFESTLNLRDLFMMSIRATTLTVAGVVSLLTIGACKKNDEAKPADSPAAALPVPADTAPKALEVGEIYTGKHVGPDSKVTEATEAFAPKDTMYAAVDTKNAGSAKLTARWTAEDGKVVTEETKSITPTGDATTSFFLVAPAKVGKYTVHVLLNDAEMKSKEVTVAKASAKK